MPRLADEVLRDAGRAADERQQSLASLPPGPASTPEGCSAPLTATGDDENLAGFGVCAHHAIPADSLEQSMGMALRFELTLRLREPDTSRAMDLLARWREHLSGLPEAAAANTAAMITWPSREVSGVRALMGYGMQPIEVIAARPARYTALATDVPGLVIREAGPDDLEVVTEMMVAVYAALSQ